MDLDEKRAAFGRDMAQDVAHGRIDVIGDQYFIAGLQTQRAQYRVASGRRVLDEDEIGGLSADEIGKGGRRIRQPLR